MTITRLWQAGFESRSMDEISVPNGATLGGNGRTGSYSAQLQLGITDRMHQIITGTKQVRVGFAVNFSDYIGNGEFSLLRNGTTPLIELLVDSATANVALEVATVQQDITTNSPMVYSTYYHFGIDCKIDAAAGWVKVYMNGSEILSFAGNTGNVDIDQVVFGTIADFGGGNGYALYDDLYIDDSTGEGSASVCSMLRFYWAYPSGNGNYSQWVGSDGNSTDNYLLVDERPPLTSDCVISDAIDEYDSYTMANIALGPGQTVAAVIPMAYAQRYGTAEEMALGTRYSGTDLIGSDQDPGFGAWNFLHERQTTKPGGGAWDQTSIDAMEVIIKSRGSF